MEEKIEIRSNSYFDSVTLMSISQLVQRIDGVDSAMIGMGTPLNLDVLQSLGFAEAVAAGPNDLILAVRAVNTESVENALAEANELMTKGIKKAGNTAKGPAKSLAQALEQQASNLVLISVPGAYAAREARKALDRGLHVMLFSDNVTIEDEVALKKMAHDKGLLVMGPDCGTAIINGVPLAFANKVHRGSIGIVGASGTGTQEVSVQVDRMGQGCSQVIGTGGRDLKQAVGGIMMLDGIEALKQDPETKVIVVVSKPAAPEVAEQVYQALSESGKPAVLYVIGSKGELAGNDQVHTAKNLLEASQIAVQLAGGSPILKEEVNQVLLDEVIKGLKPGQKYVRGLFSGGTLCDEAMEVLSAKLGVVYSNGPLVPEGELKDPYQSYKNTVLDLGDDLFTVGRPHPMIDLSLRIARIMEEVRDPEVAVILLDVVLGYGSNADPAAELVPAIKKAKQLAAEAGRKITFVAYICGTTSDPQGLATQVAAFHEAGVIVFPSNVEAAEFTAAVLSAVEGDEN